MLAVFVVYLPAMNGGFLCDDKVDVVDNTALRSWIGLNQIWSQPGITAQYYPLSFATFWLNYQLGELDPLGYHLVNVLLHSCNAVLLWSVLRKLKIPGAWLAAGLFALHPVQVESVAYVSERKNVLSGFFFFCALLSAIKFWLSAIGNTTVWREVPRAGEAVESTVASTLEPVNPSTLPTPHRVNPIFDPLFVVRSTCPANVVKLFEYGCSGLAKLSERYRTSDFNGWLQKWKYYGFTIVFYLCALAAKTAVLPLPAVILLMLWWRRRLTRREVGLLIPLVLLGVVFGLITMRMEHHIIATVTPWKLSWLQRCLLAGRDFWFYLGKLFWPHPLIFTYPRWNILVSDWREYLPVPVLAVGFWVLWQKREGWGRPVLFVLGYFLAMLFLTLGFIDIGYFRYAFVADHFQYLACIAPLTLAGVAATAALERFGKIAYLPPVGAVALLLILGSLTWQQAATYANAETLWQTTLEKNPDCALAEVDLGQCYFQQDHRVDDAIELDRRAIQLDPGFYEAWNNLGVCLAYKGLTDQAMDSFRQALKINPGYENSTVVLAALLDQTNNYAAAIVVYQDALKSNPDMVWAQDDLAWLLATCPDARFRDGTRAVNLAEHACRLTHYEEPAPVRTLSAAYAEAGQFTNAVDSASLAEQLFAKQGNTPQALTSMKMLSLFQAGQPYREPPPLSGKLQAP